MASKASVSTERKPQLPAVLVIVAVNLALLVLGVVLTFIPRMLGLQPQLVWHGQVWRVITYAFIHGGWGHFLGNSLALIPFALFLEYRYGRAKFIGVYLGTSAVVGVFLTLIGQAAIGASGAVCAIAMLAVLELIAGESRSVWVIIPEMLLGAAVIVLWVLPALWGDLMNLFSRDGISHWGHLAGFASGFAFFRIRKALGGRRGTNT